MPLPDFVVIGAAKCGTTSLYRYLQVHPEIGMSSEKEPVFFLGGESWDRGLDWYRSLFPDEGRRFGEASTSYAKYPYFSGVPERMHSVIPQAQLVYMYRDPLEQILSHYIHLVLYEDERRSLRQALRRKETSYFVGSARFLFQLEQYLPYYPADRIHVMALDDLASNRRSALETLFGFLGVATDFDHPAYERAYFQTRVSVDKERRQGLSRVPEGDDLLRLVRGEITARELLLEVGLDSTVDLLDREYERFHEWREVGRRPSTGTPA